MKAVWLWFRTYLTLDDKIDTTVPLGFEMNLLRGRDHFGFRMTFDAFIKLVVKLTQRVEGRRWAGIPISSNQNRTLKSILGTICRLYMLENDRLMRITGKLEQLQQGGGSGSEFELEAIIFAYQCSESRVAQVREVYQLLVPNLPPQPIPLPAELAELSLEQVREMYNLIASTLPPHEAVIFTPDHVHVQAYDANQLDPAVLSDFCNSGDLVPLAASAFQMLGCG